MHIKKYKEKYSKKVMKKPVKKVKVDVNWIFKISVLSFLISLGFAFISEMIIPNVNIAISVFLVLFFIFLGIIFDMIGVSVTASDQKMFLSMDSKRVYGAHSAVKLIKNAHKVSSFCNDVIGDICGVVSGSAGISIAVSISHMFDISLILCSMMTTAIVASLTIGGKALGKDAAINKSNLILFEASKVVAFFTGSR